MARVFALEPCRQDISSARKFGRITYLFERDGDRSSIWAPEFPREIVQKLDALGFEPDVDFFVVAGQMVPLVIAISSIVATYGATNVLFYSSTERHYVTRTIGGYIDD